MQKLSMNLEIEPSVSEEIYQEVEKILIDYIHQSDALSNIDKLEYDEDGWSYKINSQTKTIECYENGTIYAEMEYSY